MARRASDGEPERLHGIAVRLAEAARRRVYEDDLVVVYVRLDDDEIAGIAEAVLREARRPLRWGEFVDVMRGIVGEDKLRTIKTMLLSTGRVAQLPGARLIHSDAIAEGRVRVDPRRVENWVYVQRYLEGRASRKT